ncbi:MAG TPA: hypothetical protein G4O08_06300 [Anaerolineae bacterium]|nr:hypothetical protein [Anaerolineae bacterium]
MRRTDKGQRASGSELGMGQVIKWFRAFMKLAPVKTILVQANMALAKLTYHDKVYPQRVQEYDQAVIEFTKGCWYASAALQTKAGEDWREAFKALKRSKLLGERLYKVLHSGSAAPILTEFSTTTSEGTEIDFVDGVPLVPEICPVVILQGTDHEMGYQYAQQLIHIFGSWILEQKARRPFTEDQLAHMKAWESHIREFTPEIIPFCEGWAAGAADAGVPMCYEDVLDLWTGHGPPKTAYMGREGNLASRVTPLACSGAAAWGRATSDGRLVTGSSGDHQVNHMVTIVAFPETGNNYIFTPFGATGSVPIVGACHMFGHPGMNNKGLAYVHHGGIPRMIESTKEWGYGLRRGASIFHILRFADDARQALEMELSYPIGDVGLDTGTVGGFYADRTYGYVLESRKHPVIVRESGVMGETDFLYANNNAQHPDANAARWMTGKRVNWRWDEHGGWHPQRARMPRLFVSDIEDLLAFAYEGSRRRNLYAFERLNRAIGKIGFEYMKALFRPPRQVPADSWNKLKAAYKRTGAWGKVAVGNPTNAVIGIMQPDDGDEGIYAACIGEAKRGLMPNSPLWSSFNPTYAETNAFFQIKLAADPEGVSAHAQETAQSDLEIAESMHAELDRISNACGPLNDLLEQARHQLERGRMQQASARETAGRSEALYELARATRSFTRAQVHARQVINALASPPEG